MKLDEEKAMAEQKLREEREKRDSEVEKIKRETQR
jgi:hypothetical protein